MEQTRLLPEFPHAVDYIRGGRLSLPTEPEDDEDAGPSTNNMPEVPMDDSHVGPVDANEEVDQEVVVSSSPSIRSKMSVPEWATMRPSSLDGMAASSDSVEIDELADDEFAAVIDVDRKDTSSGDEVAGMLEGAAMDVDSDSDEPKASSLVVEGSSVVQITDDMDIVPDLDPVEDPAPTSGVSSSSTIRPPIASNSAISTIVVRQTPASTPVVGTWRGRGKVGPPRGRGKVGPPGGRSKIVSSRGGIKTGTRSGGSSARPSSGLVASSVAGPSRLASAPLGRGGVVAGPLSSDRRGVGGRGKYSYLNY